MATALIIIDMQKAYFANQALEDEREELIRACNLLVGQARATNSPVIMLRTLHEADKSTWTLNMLDDEEGYLLKGEEDGDYISGLDIAESIEIIKTRDSGFWHTDLQRELHSRDIDTVILAGVSTHSCIMATAMDAYNANLRVILATDAIASHDPERHRSTFDMLQQEYRMTLATSTDDTIWK